MMRCSLLWTIYWLCLLRANRHSLNISVMLLWTA